MIFFTRVKDVYIINLGFDLRIESGWEFGGSIK